MRGETPIDSTRSDQSRRRTTRVSNSTTHLSGGPSKGDRLTSQNDHLSHRLAARDQFCMIQRSIHPEASGEVGEVAVPGWLALTLAVAFALVAAHRGARRDVPGALMALGMAIMAVAMAGPAEAAALGPTSPHGPWWAAGFAVVALWPLVRRGRAGRVCGGPVSHLFGGLAMIYMCMPAALPHGADPALAAAFSTTSPATPTSPLGGSGHAAHHGSMAGFGGVTSASVPLDTALALAGWALACYFLLATVTTLTRRDADGALAVARPSALGEAAMAFGTVVMLVAMT